MTGFGKDVFVSIPEITVTLSGSVGLRKIVIKLLTGLGTAISQGVGNHLSGATA